MRAVLLALLALAGPALAQEGWSPVHEVRADLDRNGAPETYALRSGADGDMDLVVASGGRERVVPGIAWAGGIGQQADLSLNPAGSVVVTSRNDSVGRSRWELALTLAHRNGAIRVAGITYAWHDTLDPAQAGLCDINLLTGRGLVETAAGRREIVAPFPPPPVWNWPGHVAFDPYATCGI